MRKFGLLIAPIAMCLAISGCGTAPSGTELPKGKPITEEQSAEKAKEVMKGMGGMYKGAPGAPKPKG